MGFQSSLAFISYILEEAGKLEIFHSGGEWPEYERQAAAHGRTTSQPYIEALCVSVLRQHMVLRHNAGRFLLASLQSSVAPLEGIACTFKGQALTRLAASACSAWKAPHEPFPSGGAEGAEAGRQEIGAAGGQPGTAAEGL